MEWHKKSDKNTSNCKSTVNINIEDINRLNLPSNVLILFHLGSTLGIYTNKIDRNIFNKGKNKTLNNLEE